MEHDREPTEKDIQEIKTILEKQHGREFSIEEASQALWDLKMFAQITYELWAVESQRKEKLLEYPKGFHIEGRGTCEICGDTASDENSWYDKHGLKCMYCQNAVNEKIIPVSVKNKDSWYSQYDLAHYFNISRGELGKFIKQSFLNCRIVKGEGKKIHLQLFLLSDNKDVLPPKKLLKSRVVQVEKKGEMVFTDEYWYEYIDEKIARKIAQYRIALHLKELFAKPINSGRFYWTKTNPLFTLK